MTKSGRHELSEHMVWYASYGSNLNRDRFMCYIAGGTPQGAQTIKVSENEPIVRALNRGARDPTPPRDSRPVRLGYELYFAGYSKCWDGASAFIRKGHDGGCAYGRMYLIADEQFKDVVLQENGKPADGTRLVPSFEDLIREKEFVLPGSPKYGRLLNIGEEGGFPILTFTSPKEPAFGAPSRAYIKVIASGLRETYQMPDSEICEYLSRAGGIKGLVDDQELAEWVQNGS